jgi:hypothetical protein
MIESKEEFNDLLNRLKVKQKESKLGKTLQTKLQAFLEVEELINLRLGGVGNWVTFEENPPKEDGRYLIKENEAVYIANYSEEEGFWYDEDFNKIYNVDEWMNLPA